MLFTGGFFILFSLCFVSQLSFVVCDCSHMHRRGKHKEKNYCTGKIEEHWKKIIVFFN